MHVQVRKRLVERLTCLWPGLPGLWWDANWVGLVVAFAFAGLLNFLLLASFIWSRPLASPYLFLGWGFAGLFWAVATGEAIRSHRGRSAGSKGLADEALFLQAQREYLRCHWFKAEQLLLAMLDSHPADADARLMLATLYRRTNRPNLAGRELDLLRRSNGYDKWQTEIEQEDLLLDELPRDEESADDSQPANAA